MSSTARQSRYRTRLREGRAVLAVEVDEVGLVALLIDAGALLAEQADDREAIARALEAQIRTLVEFHELGLSGDVDA